jgi:quercetin dioxygenase-like cupin family protein
MSADEFSREEPVEDPMTSFVSMLSVTVLIGTASLAAWAAGPTAPAQPTTAPIPAGSAPAGAAETSIIESLKEIKWGPAPPNLPAGSEMAVMAGDPAKSGFVSLRVKVPAGYEVPPHFHPTDEHVTVLQGTMAFGMGDNIDSKKAHTVNAGGYFIARAQMHHYAIAKTAAVIQIDLMGPFSLTYVNPADDPSKRSPR